jgi:hypothetical protein
MADDRTRIDKSDPNGDVLDRLEFCVGPWRDYKLVADVKAEISRLREAQTVDRKVIAKQTALIAEMSFRLEKLKLKPTPREIELTDALHDLYDLQDGPPKDKHGIPIEF